MQSRTHSDMPVQSLSHEAKEQCDLKSEGKESINRTGIGKGPIGMETHYCRLLLAAQ